MVTPYRRRRRPNPAPFIAGLAALMVLSAAALWGVKQSRENSRQQSPPATREDSHSAAGARPFVNPVTGTVKVVDDYLQDNLHDPEVQYVKWGPLHLYTDEVTGEQAWHVMLKWRGRNRLNAWVLTEDLFVIRNGKVVNVIRGEDQ